MGDERESEEKGWDRMKRQSKEKREKREKKVG